jgi:hypothetical protein
MTIGIEIHKLAKKVKERSSVRGELRSVPPRDEASSTHLRYVTVLCQYHLHDRIIGVQRATGLRKVKNECIGRYFARKVFLHSSMVTFARV